MQQALGQHLSDRISRELGFVGKAARAADQHSPPIVTFAAERQHQQSLCV